MTPAGGRGARTARLAGYASQEAIRASAGRLTDLARSADDRQQARDERASLAAERLVRVLASMKGGALKLGQMLAVVEPGVLPPDVRELVQRELANVHEPLAPVAPQKITAVVEEELGRPLHRCFARFDTAPVASASIGQVHRAVLLNGDEVAVKVQHPGIGPSLRADLKNFALLMRLAGRGLPGVDTAVLAQELCDRMLEELDFSREAEHQRLFAEVYAGHPFIRIPRVVAELSGPRVLVTEFVDGRSIASLEGAPQAVRDRVGEIVFRFYLGSVHRVGAFTADPNPGNVIVGGDDGDGRVTFLDFGLFKVLDPRAREHERACEEAVAHGDADRLHGLLIHAGLLRDPGVTAQETFAYASDVTSWYLGDRRATTITPDLVTATAVLSADPRSPYFATLRYQNLPPEHLLTRRLNLLTLGLLGRLRARAPWRSIAGEWLWASSPQTPLGRDEARHWTRADTPVANVRSGG